MQVSGRNGLIAVLLADQIHGVVGRLFGDSKGFCEILTAGIKFQALKRGGQASRGAKRLDMP
jgi:hypothetical protein